VALVGGSGPADRSNGGYFDALRHRLVGAGVAVLGFDKRGVGGSTGDWASAGIRELAADVAGAVAALRAHPLVDSRAVGLLGHSEGGWVALRAATHGAPPGFLVLSSCPAVSFFEAEVHALTVAGVKPDRARALFGHLRDAVHADAALATALQVIADEPDPVLREVLDRAGFRLTDETYSQLRAWIDYVPDADLDDLRTPTLAVYGTRDPLTPVQASLDRLAARAATVRTRTFLGADHRLCIDGKLAPGYLDAAPLGAPHRFPRRAHKLTDGKQPRSNSSHARDLHRAARAIPITPTVPRCEIQTAVAWPAPSCWRIVCWERKDLRKAWRKAGPPGRCRASGGFDGGPWAAPGELRCSGRGRFRFPGRAAPSERRVDCGRGHCANPLHAAPDRWTVV
jgi:uncharacterized protein